MVWYLNTGHPTIQVPDKWQQFVKTTDLCNSPTIWKQFSKRLVFKWFWYLNVQFSDPHYWFERGMQFSGNTKVNPSKTGNIHKPVLNGLVIERSGYSPETDKNIQVLNGWMPFFCCLSKTGLKHPVFEWSDLRNWIRAVGRYVTVEPE